MGYKASVLVCEVFFFIVSMRGERPLSVYMRFYLTLKSSIILHFDRTKT